MVSNNCLASDRVAKVLKLRTPSETDVNCCYCDCQRSLSIVND